MSCFGLTGPDEPVWINPLGLIVRVGYWEHAPEDTLSQSIRFGPLHKAVWADFKP